MLVEWSFELPVKVGVTDDAFAAVARQLGGRRAMLVASEGFCKRGGEARLQAVLGGQLAGTVSGVVPNPDPEALAHLVKGSRRFEFEVLVAMGGGSVIDSAKVLAVAAEPWWQDAASIKQFLEQGARLSGAATKPVIAVPTTAGSGSEVTSFATIWECHSHRKYSIDDRNLMPEAAILDHKLTHSLPETQTISTGLDAVSQALESIWNRKANPVTVTIATESLRRSLPALPRLLADPSDGQARADMLLGSTMAGLAISQTRTGIAHSISYPLTAHFGVSHGLACSFTLPEILGFNARQDDGRLAQLARALGFREINELVARLRDVLNICRVGQRLREHLPSAAAVRALLPEMLTPGRADNNMAPLTPAAVAAILAGSLPLAWVESR